MSSIFVFPMMIANEADCQTVESLMMCIKIRASLLFTIGCGLFLAGCGNGKVEYTGTRVETTAVEGTVFVDGSPASAVHVICVAPDAGPDEVLSSAYTDDNGQFALGTYDGNDGIPAGSYIVLFESTGLLFGKPDYGVDRFEGRYKDPATSTFKITVVNGEPLDMGKVELSSK